jgi:hypothetical protein
MAVIEIPRAEELAQQAQTTLARAQAAKIMNAEQYQGAAAELLRIKGIRSRIDDLFDPVVKQAHEAHKAACAAKKQLTDPLDNAERALKGAMGAYDQEQRRLAAAEEARLRAIAEQKAAEERARLEAKAEKAIEKGQEEKAEAFLDQAAAVVPLTPVVVPQTVKVAGVQTRYIRKARVTKPQDVPAYWAGVELRTINQSALNALAKLSPDKPSEIPGVEFYDEPQIAAATGR